LRARRLVIRSTSAYACAGLSSSKRCQRESRADGRGRCVKTSSRAGFERVERREAASREQADGAPDAAADARLQEAAGGQQRSRPRRLEPKQLEELRGSGGRARDGEADAVLRGQVRRGRAARSRGTSWRKLTSWSPVQTSSGRDELGVERAAEAEHEAARPDRPSAGSTHAGRPRSRIRTIRWSIRFASISLQEGLPRQGRTRGSSAAAPHHGPGGVPVHGSPRLELVERGRPPASLVAEDVDEAGEP
jgi:hypothetical protein